MFKCFSAAFVAAMFASSADAATYRALVESDADRASGSEVVAVTFDAFDDFLTSNFTNNGFSDLNIGPNFSIGGLAYDG